MERGEVNITDRNSIKSEVLSTILPASLLSSGLLSFCWCIRVVTDREIWPDIRHQFEEMIKPVRRDGFLRLGEWAMARSGVSCFSRPSRIVVSILLLSKTVRWRWITHCGLKIHGSSHVGVISLSLYHIPHGSLALATCGVTRRNQNRDSVKMFCANWKDLGDGVQW